MTLRNSTYETKNNYETVFNRVRLDVERVAVLTNPLVGHATVDTTKPWVGKINGSEGTFQLVKTNSSVLFPLRYLEGNFFTLFITGKVFREDQSTRVEVAYKIGWYTAVFFMAAYIFPIVLFSDFIIRGDWDSAKGLLPWFLIFDVIPTTLLIFQMNRTDDKIAELVGAE